MARRVRQDTSAIDGVIVAECYFYGDGFDYCLLTSFEYVPINLANPFSSFDQLQKAWNEWANRFATAMVQGRLEGDLTKGSQIDKQFDYEGVTFVLPTASTGQSSEFYVAVRPRQNTSDWSVVHQSELRSLTSPSENGPPFGRQSNRRLMHRREGQGREAVDSPGSRGDGGYTWPFIMGGLFIVELGNNCQSSDFFVRICNPR